MIDKISQIREFGVIGVHNHSNGRMQVTLFCGFDVNSMAHVYVMHVCKLYMACVSCLSAGRSQSVVIILYNDLRVDL